MTEGSFLYYLPHKKFEGVTAELLQSNPVLAGPFFEHIHSPRMLKNNLIGGNVLNNGPDGGSGCVIAPQPQGNVDQDPRYDAETQTWQKFGEHWIGWKTDMLPGPESLRRATMLDGYEVELGDGRVWQAPVIRAFQEKDITWIPRIPMVWGIGRDMTPIAEPLNKYRAAWEMSAKVFASVCGGVPATMLDVFGWAVECLQLNYRIGSIEASVLQVFNDDTMREVLQASVDVPLLEASEKKSGEPKNPT